MCTLYIIRETRTKILNFFENLRLYIHTHIHTYTYAVGSLFKTPGSYLINHEILGQGLIKRDPNKWHLPTLPGSLGSLESTLTLTLTHAQSTKQEEPEEEAANVLSARLQARTLCERSVVKPQKGVLPC